MKIDRLTWDDLRYLLEVHRRGSFFAAATALGLSTSTVARRIEALERDLGHSLVRRSPQGATLEAEALPLLAPAMELEQSLVMLGRDRASTADSPFAGTVRISLPDGFGAAAATAAARLRRRHPETHVEIVTEARFVDLAAREADIGVRGGRSSSRVLLERPLGEIRAGLYASPHYLAKRLPRRVLADADYATQDFITHEPMAGPTQWMSQRGAVRFPIVSAAFDARLKAAQEHMGIVTLAVGLPYPGLRRITLATPLPAIRFYLTMRRDLRTVPRVRALATEVQGIFAEFVAVQQKEEVAHTRAASRRSG